MEERIIMLDRVPYLQIIESGQNRIRLEFHDNKIFYGFNVQSQQLEAWYKPNSGRAYKITECNNEYHAIKLMRGQLELEKRMAKDVLKEIDEHNDRLLKDKDEDAMCEMRSEMKSIASGKQYFTMANTQARSKYANLRHSQ
jgi:hypothetical protein